MDRTLVRKTRGSTGIAIDINVNLNVFLYQILFVEAGTCLAREKSKKMVPCCSCWEVKHIYECNENHLAHDNMHQIRGGADYILLETINCWEEAALGLEGISRIPNAPPCIVSLEGAFRGVNLKPHPTKSAHSFRALWPRIKTAPTENPVPIVTEDEHIQQYENKFNLLDPRHAKLVHKENPKPVHVACIGFNCAPPEEILIALRALKEDAALDGNIKVLTITYILNKKRRTLPQAQWTHMRFLLADCY